MSKGQETREAILIQAIELFNVKGYAGTSIADVMQATGMTKGGIYNHFENKEALAVEAFDYAYKCISDLMVQALNGKRDPIPRLLAIIAFFRTYFELPPFKGGCVLLNTAIESDDDMLPALRERARHGMSLWQDLIRRTVVRGVAQGVMRPTVDPDGVATLIIGTLEGALMMSKLFDNPGYIRTAVDHMLDYVENNICS